VRSLNAQGMTIIYTSHYMEEVEYLCNRVGIIDRGRIIACGTVDELRQVVGEDAHLVLNVVGYQESLNDRLLALDEVKHLTVEGDQLTVVSAVPALALGAISHLLAEAGVTLRSVQIDEPNLEAVFLHLTGRALRD
jgi:ABC-2 type transport system ATP-binding protein